MIDSPEVRLVTAAREQWETLVRLACSGTDPNKLAEAIQVSPAVLKRKFAAITFLREVGWAEHSIVAAGQGGTLSAYAKAKKNGHSEKQRMLRWRVSASLADAFCSFSTSQDQEESLVARLIRVCGLKTSDDLFDFILSVFASWSDAELLHHAGEAIGKKEKNR